MRFLRAGATATEAVEAALRILEDKEITNAGYGSNLSINGSVECDATVVDHLGRSGACGAVPSTCDLKHQLSICLVSDCFLLDIRNPISLAKLILDMSSKPLSLRRVPPNVLVGDGAREFAEEYGMTTFANEFLVSKNARDRFLRWQEDLKRADGRSKASKEPLPPDSASLAHKGCVPYEFDTATAQSQSRASPRDHSAAIMAGTWNEGQPDSPWAGTPVTESSSNLSDTNLSVNLGSPVAVERSGRLSPDRTVAHSTSVTQGKGPSSPLTRLRGHGKKAETTPRKGSVSFHSNRPASNDASAVNRDGSTSPVQPSVSSRQGPHQARETSMKGKRHLSTTDEDTERQRRRKTRQTPTGQEGEDFVTDTIGAIAIDDKGLIAAASSSGGIGMKHRGRLGPAALVGVGTAVVPCAEDDEDGVTVACVTSGTGEHMATTVAAQRCAERIYRGNRRGPRGTDIQDDDEDAIMESFIVDDFMNHPGVKNCHSAGAIGIMVVKKCTNGYYLYFSHNTDSFALASMGAGEKEPRCTMSRLPEGATIAKGGRKVRID
jgi:taspase (threonine aspartase 1)